MEEIFQTVAKLPASTIALLIIGGLVFLLVKLLLDRRKKDSVSDLLTGPDNGDATAETAKRELSISVLALIDERVVHKMNGHVPLQRVIFDVEKLRKDHDAHVADVTQFAALDRRIVEFVTETRQLFKETDERIEKLAEGNAREIQDLVRIAASNQARLDGLERQGRRSGDRG